ncbi:MAG: tetratricopeptide repeat protein [Planctomycetes bacterium]|nr:tetratricopeptide repeat protein [Planctomycetota bacterium]
MKPEKNHEVIDVTYRNNTGKSRRTAFIYIIPILLFLSFSVYLNTLLNTFVFDDSYTVSENYFIRDWKNISYLFTHKYFVAFGEISYRPVVTLSYFADYLLWHMNPMGYHLTNVIFHTLNSILMFFLIRQISQNTVASFTGALIFICHPLLSEAVNAISYREDLFVVTFSIAAFIFFIKTFTHRKYYYYSPLSLLSYLFALFSKEMAITLPFLLALADYLLLNTLFKTGKLKTNTHYLILKKRLPLYGGYIFISIFYLFTRFLWFRNPVSYDNLNQLGNSLSQFLSMTTVLASYIKLLFFPMNLNADYVVPVIRSFAELPFILSSFLIITLSIVIYRLRVYSKILLFAILWFFLALLPVINIIPIGNIMAERYLYFPMIGFCFLGGILLSRISTSHQHPSLSNVFLRISLIVIILTGFSWQVKSRANDWKDHYSFWSGIISREPNSYRAHNSLSVLLLAKGKVDEALSAVQTALSVNPSYPESHNNLGHLYLRKGKYDMAIEEFDKALHGDPVLISAHYNKGIAYSNRDMYENAEKEFIWCIENGGKNPSTLYLLGSLYMKQDKHDEAIEIFRYLLSENPENPDLHKNLGVLYSKKGQQKDAIDEYNAALHYNPEDTGLHHNLGIEYFKRNQHVLAFQEFKQTLQAYPENINVLINIGNQLYAREDWDTSIEMFKTILEYQANNTEIRCLLANAYLKKGNSVNDAILQYKEILSYNQKHLEARNNLGIVYINERRYDEAIREFKEALTIYPDNLNILKNIGNLYFLNKMWDESIEIFQSILHLQNDDINAHYQLANAYYNKGYYEKAQQQLERGLTQTKDPAAINLLKSIQQQLNGNDRR